MFEKIGMWIMSKHPKDFKGLHIDISSMKVLKVIKKAKREVTLSIFLEIKIISVL